MEQSLVEHVCQGKLLDLPARGEAVDAAAMRSWGKSRTCRASVLRDILRGRLAADPDPHGLRLRGARITGRLDLENVTTDVALELQDCLLEEGVLARDARMVAIILVGCQLEHPGEPPLYGDRMTCSVLDLSGARVIGRTSRGAVSLAGAHIGGGFNCVDAHMRNKSGAALFAPGLQVDQDMVLGSFNLPTIITGSGDNGVVNLVGAHIRGKLACYGAELANNDGPALFADGLQVDQDMVLGNRFTTTVNDGFGAVRLADAHIRGKLECIGARLSNHTGPALTADRLQVDQDMVLGDGFTAIGRWGGTVRLVSARIGGNLYCGRAKLRNDLAKAPGPALRADGLQVGQYVILADEFTATGDGDQGAVSLAGAHIGGNLDCLRAKLRNDSGSALLVPRLQVDQDINLRSLTARGGGEGVTVDLTGARVGRTLLLDPAQLEHAVDPHRLLAVDGLTYASVPEPLSGGDWLQLLRDCTPRYAAQPYQQVAAVHRALGDERKVRHVLIAQRDNQLARTHTRWPERAWGWITKVTLGYGYQPWRALLFLAGVVVASCVLAVVLGAHGALAQTDKTAAPGRPCTVMQQVSVGLDLNLPVGTSVARADCDLTKDSASVTAAWLTAVGWVLRLLAWVFAALFIAGFTSAVRKT